LLPKAVEKIHELSVKVDAKDNANQELRRDLLIKCAATAMSSKLIHQVPGSIPRLLNLQLQRQRCSTYARAF
jgi:hypothetical protein